VACRDEPYVPVLLVGWLRTPLARLVCIRTRQHSTGTRRSPVPGRVACVRGAKSEAKSCIGFLSKFVGAFSTHFLALWSARTACCWVPRTS
jgi:hypothetical protein